MARQDEPDIRLKIGFFSHPKTLRVERAVGAEGVLCLIRLLMFVRVNRHKDGSLAGYSDDDIEGACGWHRCERYASGMLVASLSDAGYLEGDAGARRIHEWAHHQSFAANFSKRSRAGKANAKVRWERTYSMTQSASKPHAKGMRVACEPDAPTPTPAPMAGVEADAPVAPTAPVAPPVRKSAIVAPLMTFPPPRAMP